MTREDAIEFGKMWLEVQEDCKNSITYKFFKMAIEALQQELIFDKIRAEISKAWYTHPQSRYEEGLKDQALRDMKIIDKYKAESEVLEDGNVD